MTHPSVGFPPSRQRDRLFSRWVGGVLSLIIGCLLVGLVGSQPVWAGVLSQRLADFPDWQTPPMVQAANGDLQYPDWFVGTWEVQTTLVDMVAPLSPEIVTPGFESNRTYLQQPIQFQARFVTAPLTLGKWLPLPPSLLQTAPGLQSHIVADRVFNGQNLARAYLQPASDTTLIVKGDPSNPNRQITFLGSDRQLVSTVIARGIEEPDPNQFVTSEIFQQEFRNRGQIYINQVETTTAYQRSPQPNAEQPWLTADQVTAIYLSPQDPQFFQARDRPVALYRYQLEFRPVQPD